jgi:hypothetical protein
MAQARSRGRSWLREALSPSSACATPLELGRLADGSLARNVAARLRDHVSGCARCLTELTLLKEFEDAAPGPDEERAVRSISARLERQFSGTTSPARPHLPRRPWFAGRNLGGFALAAATLVAALAIGLREGRAPELSAGSPAAPAVLRSAAIATLSPAGDLDAPPSELRWEPTSAAASYSVQVMEVDNAELWSAQTRDPSIALPEALRARVVPGKPLLWEVVAKDGAGRPVAWSGKQRFRVKFASK